MKRTIGIIMFAAGLLCSCGQSQQEGQEPQGAELEQWHVIGDSLSGLKRVQKWEAYVAENPKDEMGWRNLYEAKRCFAFYDHPQFDNKSRKEFIKRVKKAIPDTYTYYLLAKDVVDKMSESDKCAEEAMKRMPEHPVEEDYKEWCYYLSLKNDKRLKDMLTRYYQSGLVSPDVLYYHYNELQGMEEGGIYFCFAEDDVVPKQMIQMVFGLHKDKVLVTQSQGWNHIWKKCGIPEPDENWAETTPRDKENPEVYYSTQTLKLLAWIGEHSERPVYFPAYHSSLMMKARCKSKLPQDILRNLYNEGLLVRYSSKPYDNMAVACRNVEERYLLDYLYLPFVYTKDGAHTVFDAQDLAYQTIVLLQDLLPHYKKYNPERCHWLSGLLLKSLDRWKKQIGDDSYKALEPDIRRYYEATKI